MAKQNKGKMGKGSQIWIRNELIPTF